MQRYLWQQADGRRHVYDTTGQHPARPGETLDVLCGETVTVRTQDVTSSMWFDPECPVCAIVLARALRWSGHELRDLARRFDWTGDRLARLAAALRCTAGQATHLLGLREAPTR